MPIPATTEVRACKPAMSGRAMHAKSLPQSRGATWKDLVGHGAMALRKVMRARPPRGNVVKR